MTGFDPAGGWAVRVAIMAEIEQPTARAKDHGWGPIQCNAASPMVVQMRWPARTFIGCANGASGYPNTNTQEAPKDPSNSMTSSRTLSKASAPMVTKPPSPPNRIARADEWAGRLPPAPRQRARKLRARLLSADVGEARASPTDTSDLAGVLGIFHAIGVRAHSGKLAALYNQIFVANRPILKVTLEYFSRAGCISRLC
jgi:hypothetical protein